MNLNLKKKGKFRMSKEQKDDKTFEVLARTEKELSVDGNIESLTYGDIADIAEAELSFSESESGSNTEADFETLEEMPEDVEADASNSLQLYLRDVYKIPPLEPYEELDLADRMMEGDESAQRRLVEASLRYVVNIARKYRRKDIRLMDLIQEGNIGLIRAVERFDIAKGQRFATYAAFWIRHAITKAINEQTRTIHVPTHILIKIMKLKKATKILTEKLGRHPTMKELAEKLHTTQKNIEKTLLMIRRPIPIESPINEMNNDGTVEDLVEDKNATSPMSHVVNNDVRMQIIKVLENTLTPKEELVIRLRFGISDGRARSLDETGQVFGITRETTRQVEKSALTKLREADGIKEKLYSFLTDIEDNEK